MADRRPVERSGGTAILRPAAAPVETFEDPGPNRLEGVAQALKGLSGSLRGFMEQGDKEKEELDRIRGEADFYRNNGESIAEGVRTERIPAQSSAEYVRGFKTAEGTAFGQRLRQDFNTAYDEWTGKDDATNAEAYDQFFSGWVAERLKGVEDPQVLRGILPQIRQMQQEGYQRHTVFRHDKLIDDNVRTSGAILNAEIGEVVKESRYDPNGVDLDKVYASVDAQRQRLVSVGTPAAKADLMVMTTVAAQAEASNSEELLQFFDRKVPGQDFTYGTTPEGFKLLTETRDRIKTNLAQADAAGRAAMERAEKAEKDRTTLAIMETLRKDPTAVVPEETMAAARKVNPKVDEEVVSWRKTFAGSGITDPEALADVNRRIFAGEGRQAVLDAARAGVFANPSDFDAAMARADKVGQNQQKMGEVLQTPTAKNITDAIKLRTLNAEDVINPQTGLSAEGMEADYDFRYKLNEWIAANPNANAIEIDKAVAEIGTSILGNFKPGAGKLPGSSGGNTYERPEGTGFDNPYSALAAKEGQGEAPFSIDPGGAIAPPKDKAEPGFFQRWFGWGDGAEEEPAAEQPKGEIKAPEASTAPEPTSPQDLMQGFTPEQRAVIEQEAEAAGVTVEQFLQGAQPETEQPQASPINYTAPAPGDERFLRRFAVAGATRPDSFSGMTPAFSSSLQQMIASAPPDIAAELRIMSGYRSVQRQAELWNAALKKYGSAAAARKWVAPPGKSGHNHGHAADLQYASRKARRWAHANAAKFGLAFPLGNEPWHIELASARSGGGGGGFKVPKATMASASGASGSYFGGITKATAEDYLRGVSLMSDEDDNDFEGSADTGDARTDRLLNLIGQGEAGGNYNAVFGNGASTVDLSKMTLEEILEQQRKAVAAGSPSSAIGKYQVLRKTLAGAAQEMGLTGKERFTPKLQDAIAVHLLERRGYSLWREGKLSTSQFARRLSQEWAALPNPETGESYYAGGGLNAARVRPREVYAALGLLDV